MPASVEPLSPLAANFPDGSRIPCGLPVPILPFLLPWGTLVTHYLAVRSQGCAHLISKLAHVIMNKLFLFIATGAGSGYLPKAPGTWGSLVGVFLWIFFSRLTVPVYLISLLVLFFVGVLCAGATEKIMGSGDPGLVVIDEIVGQLLTFILVPLTPLNALLGFCLFRLFDILKPFPVGWFDQHIHGGLGIMLDDIIAGFYALAVLHLGIQLIQMI